MSGTSYCKARENPVQAKQTAKNGQTARFHGHGKARNHQPTSPKAREMRFKRLLRPKWYKLPRKPRKCRHGLENGQKRRVCSYSSPTECKPTRRKPVISAKKAVCGRFTDEADQLPTKTEKRRQKPRKRAKPETARPQPYRTTNGKPSQRPRSQKPPRPTLQASTTNKKPIHRHDNATDFETAI